MTAIAVYPGSFDPVTKGHLNIAIRAAGLFDELHIVVVHNPSKSPLFSSEERVRLITASLHEMGIAKATMAKIKIDTLDGGLLVNYCRMVHASALVKGVRTNVDLDYELPMALVNRDLAGVETVFLPADPKHGQISSSLVKQVAALGGDVSSYVTEAVANALAAERKNSNE
ncbi:MAG: pantetheine-phosphate adenylyltransferase [Micrococcales bacterium]